MTRSLFLGIFFILIFAPVLKAEPSLRLTSSAFENKKSIPAEYSCDGQDHSPPLAWKGVPARTQSLALVMEDPDAPGAVFTHWVLYDIPPILQGIPKGFPAIPTLANGEKHGTNDFRTGGYGGPCPPSGRHHYIFTLYALDAPLHLDPGLTKEQFLRVAEGHILAKAKLTGLYKRKSA